MKATELLEILSFVGKKIGCSIYDLSAFKTSTSAASVDLESSDLYIEPKKLRIRVGSDTPALRSVAKLIGVKHTYLMSASDTLKESIFREALPLIGPRSVVYEDYQAFKVVKAILPKDHVYYPIAEVVRDLMMANPTKNWVYEIQGNAPHPGDHSVAIKISRDVSGTMMGVYFTYNYDGTVGIDSYTTLPTGARLSSLVAGKKTITAKPEKASEIIAEILDKGCPDIEWFLDREWRGATFEAKLITESKLLKPTERKQLAARILSNTEATSVRSLFEAVI